MQVINLKAARDFVKYIAIEMREPVMLWGQPGVGKSEVIAQLAKEYGADLCDIRLSQYDSVDLRGIPVPDVGAMLTHWVPPSTLPFAGNDNFDPKRVCFLFLDELPNAIQGVQAAAYQLINDRACGEHKLHDNVIVIAAGNRDGDRGATNKMPTPLANRFTHTEIGVDVEVFSEYAISKGLSPVAVAFLNFRKNLLSTFDPSKPDKAFATPRTWVKAMRYFDHPTMSDHMRLVAMSGAVGEGPAVELNGFAKIWQSLPKISEIVKNPDTISISDDLSTRYAVAVMVSGSMNLENVSALHRYLKRLSADMVVLAWKLALVRDTRLYEADEYMDLSRTYKAVFAA